MPERVLWQFKMYAVCISSQKGKETQLFFGELFAEGELCLSATEWKSTRICYASFASGARFVDFEII